MMKPGFVPTFLHSCNVLLHNFLLFFTFAMNNRGLLSLQTQEVIHDVLKCALIIVAMYQFDNIPNSHHVTFYSLIESFFCVVLIRDLLCP